MFNFLSECNSGEKKKYWLDFHYWCYKFIMTWYGRALHASKSVPIYPNIFWLPIRVREFASFNAWHSMTVDRFGCSMFVWDERHMLFNWIIILPDFINFSANLLQKGAKGRTNGLRYCMNGNKTSVPLVSFEIHFEYENPSTVMFAIAANFYRCWLVFAYIVSEWKRWTFLYPLLINLYFSSF